LIGLLIGSSVKRVGKRPIRDETQPKVVPTTIGCEDGIFFS
jgi:hypothetical protein